MTGIELTVDRTGTGRPVVVLHGGGGPMSVRPIVEHLAESCEVLAPTVPAFDGTARPDWFDTIDDVALALLDHLRDLDLRDVVVVGSSVGGWIGAAMAVFDADADVARLARVAIVDGVGVDVPGEPIRDFFALTPREIADYSFHDGDRFFVDPATLSDAAKQAQQNNMAALRVYAGDPYMHDPHLMRRLSRVRVPVLGIWGDSDRIVTPAYGAAFLAGFPRATFHVVDDAGHLPHLEQPEATFAMLDPFVAGTGHPAS